MFVWRSNDEVAVLAETTYVSDFVFVFEIRSVVVPPAEHAVKEVLTVGEETGSGDFERSADFSSCVPYQGYECHGNDHGPNWDLVRNRAYGGLGHCFPDCRG